MHQCGPCTTCPFPQLFKVCPLPLPYNTGWAWVVASYVTKETVKMDGFFIASQERQWDCRTFRLGTHRLLWGHIGLMQYSMQSTCIDPMSSRKLNNTGSVPNGQCFIGAMEDMRRHSSGKTEHTHLKSDSWTMHPACNMLEFHSTCVVSTTKYHCVITVHWGCQHRLME